MATRADVVAAARGWLRTPFAHQARLRGIGCDCGGLVGGVAVECGLVPADWWARVFDPAFGGYARAPHRGSLTAALERFLQPIDVDAVQPGDVLVMRFAERREEDHHVGIVADYVHGGHSLIHAMSRPPATVVEHRLAPPWRGRVAAAYRFPGLEAA